MQIKSFLLFAFLGTVMAIPKPCGNGDEGDAERVAEKVAEGLNCQQDEDGGVFVCSDESGANCIINSSGGGTCL
ncbi:hypothetical protein PG994_005883 [Apiospora phragmitis]|uniref:Uncharacterized protein n=1 Tax=Apiospora phragmitis TaxID=2905665 RepID=A0ABR1VDK9_9PEZI